MTDSRPNPDALLALAEDEQKLDDTTTGKRGSLRIFFGYAAGVGKTYGMLEAAQAARREGRDVVVGYIEPHARKETQALAADFETLPTKQLSYRGVTLREFDVDAALARKAEITLVDELAHTNAEGSRHEKRWQDIEELCASGLHVWTTLNVQHLESLNDVIGQITGVQVRETIPDHVFDAADQLELIDITPEELLGRLEAGKIYLPEQAKRAIQSFFQRSNLSALRELSLRQAARRVHTDVESARRARSVRQPWATTDRLLVCVGPSPTTARVIRTAKRMASALDAPWIAVSVDLTGASSTSPASQQIAEHFRLAERLGAETVTLPGQRMTETILEYARTRNVTKILIGKTDQPRWKRLLMGTVVDEILEQSGEIDVYVIHGEKDQAARVATPPARPPIDYWLYGKAAVPVGLAGLAALAMKRWHFADAEANTVMIFLAAVAWAAFRFGRGPAIVASLLAVTIFDFFFVPPFHTFAVADTQYIVTFAVMLAIALLISTLTSRLRAQLEAMRDRQRRTAALYELGKQLSSLYGSSFLAKAAGEKIAEMVGGEVAIYLDRHAPSPELVFGARSSIALQHGSSAVAHWVIQHGQMAGAGTSTLPSAVGLFLPLIGSQRVHGAMAVAVASAARLQQPELRQLLESCASQLAISIERDALVVEAADARVKAEAEQVRSSLLSSVSHDLKTPLAAIAGASSTLLEASSLPPSTREQLLQTVAEEAVRLGRLLENILQMSKLDAGASPPHLEWHMLEEIVGSSIRRIEKSLTQHQLIIQIPEQLPLLRLDGLLMEQVFVNLLENAARYTTAGSTISVRAVVEGQEVRVTVADNGPGLPAGAEEKVFDKFYRAFPSADGGRGSGLGLAICRAIVKVHGGRIEAANLPAGGAEFVIHLPLAQDIPQVPLSPSDSSRAS
ncbi:Osmosensitive K channel His kinase sensor [Pirellula staleyi DSM 6068]|uniref:histidine kinase n=1 Tax=Pirellula staleyi (strain ATCC 27377 / DSM 6068 / ICPB 4128) TaxID=530564 RepID=D2R314_PIRSD|nr:sensor histidine kinase KdpD [Pirellula staleyi]ADB18747.1 Osmosensitive K channel His kinase sensor [Pirellula staleyi DSM 6068]